MTRLNCRKDIRKPDSSALPVTDCIAPGAAEGLNCHRKEAVYRQRLLTEKEAVHKI